MKIGFGSLVLERGSCLLQRCVKLLQLRSQPWLCRVEQADNRAETQAGIDLRFAELRCARLASRVTPVPEAVIPTFLVPAAHRQDMKPLECLAACERLAHGHFGQDHSSQFFNEGVKSLGRFRMDEAVKGLAFKGDIPFPDVRADAVRPIPYRPLRQLSNMGVRKAMLDLLDNVLLPKVFSPRQYLISRHTVVLPMPCPDSNASSVSFASPWMIFTPVVKSIRRIRKPGQSSRRGRLASPIPMGVFD